VAKIAGPDSRLIGASPAQRERLGQIAARFSEEDLTRYLQLTLELFKDLQASLQPRFHLEIGLVRLVHAGRLVAIEEALAGLGNDDVALPARTAVREPAPVPAPPPVRTSAPPPRAAAAPPSPPTRSGPSPFELDRAKKAGREPQASSTVAAAVMLEAPPAEAPANDAQWREKLHAALVELGMNFTADGVEHSSVAVSGNEVRFVTPTEFKLSMTEADLDKAIRQVAGAPMRIRITFSEGAVVTQPAMARAQQKDDYEVRALEHPEVKRYLELFGGEVRQVRNLKE
jgi:DNA polymerase-3 subunit gamma/tau